MTLRDKILFGSFIGILSTLAMDLFQIPLWRLKVVDHPLAHYAASLFMTVPAVHHTFIGVFTSLIANYVYGVFWGVVFIYFIHFTGKRRLIIKGLVFGAFLWFFSFGGLRSLPIVQLREVISDQILYYLFFHIVYGLALGIFVKIFGGKDPAEIPDGKRI